MAEKLGFLAALEPVAVEFFDYDLSKRSWGSGMHELQAEVGLWIDCFFNYLCVSSAPTLLFGPSRRLEPDFLER